MSLVGLLCKDTNHFEISALLWRICSNYCIFEVFFMPVLHPRYEIWVKNNGYNRNYQTNQEVFIRKPLKIRGLFMFDFGWCMLLITGYFPTQNLLSDAECKICKWSCRQKYTNICKIDFPVLCTFTLFNADFCTFLH